MCQLTLSDAFLGILPDCDFVFRHHRRFQYLSLVIVSRNSVFLSAVRTSETIAMELGAWAA